MILDNLRNGYNYISAKLNRGYHCISYNTKSFIYGNFYGVQSLYLFMSIILQVKNIIIHDLIDDDNVINKLKDDIFRCGCISIKFTQWIISKLKGMNNASKYKMIINKFENIFDNCEYHDIQYTKDVFEYDFNKKLGAIFDMDNLNVIASGSIGQVYKAQFKKNRNGIHNDFMIKVRHPYIDYIKFYQMILIYFIIGIQKINYFKVKYYLHFNLYDFIDNINKQIDFNIEAYNCVKIYNNYIDNDLIVVPKVYNYSNNIIISSFEDGQYVDDISEYQQCKVSLNMLCLSYNMIMVDNFMHGDLHLKNWKVRPYKNTYQIILYDFGICFEGRGVNYNKKVIEYAETQNIKELITLFLEDFNYDTDKETLINEMYDTFTYICKEPFNMNIVFNKLIFIFGTYNLIINNLYLNILLFFALLEDLWKKCNIIQQDPKLIGIKNIIKNQKMDIITFCKTYNIYPELKKITEEHLQKYITDTDNNTDNNTDTMFIRYKMSTFNFSNPDDISDDECIE